MSRQAWDFAASLVIIAIAASVIWRASQGFGLSFSDAGGVGPATLPAIYGTVLLLLSVLLAAQSLRSGVRSETDEPPFAGLPWRRMVLTFASLVALAVLLPHLPFLPLVFAFLATLFVVNGLGGRVRVLLIALTGALVLDTLFIRILGIPL